MEQDAPIPPFEKTIVLKDEDTARLMFGSLAEENIEELKKTLETNDMLSKIDLDDNFKSNNIYLEPADYTSWINMRISNKTGKDLTFVMKIPQNSSYTIVSNNNPKVEKTFSSKTVVPSTSGNNINKSYVIIIILLMVIAYLYFNRK